MKPRIAPRDGATRLFAHRGASSAAQENTVDAFTLAVRLGADGVATEAWYTADGHVMLARDGYVGGLLRRRRFNSLDRASLDAYIPSIDDLYDLVGPSINVSIDVGDPASVSAILTAARRAGDEAEDRLWLNHDDLETLAPWRRQTSANLVLARGSKASDGQPERLANELRERGVDGLSLPHTAWTAGLITLVHRFDLYALATGLVHEREMAKLLDIGIDGISSPHVDRMVAVSSQFT